MSYPEYRLKIKSKRVPSFTLLLTSITALWSSIILATKERPIPKVKMFKREQ